MWGHFSPPGPPESVEGQWDLAALAARRMPEPTFVVSFWVTEPPPSHQASHQQEMENGRKELLSLSPPNLGKKESDVLFLPVLNTNCENMLAIVYIVHIFHPTSLVFSLPRSSERVMMTFVISLSPEIGKHRSGFA